ncbi:MAG TPA: S53 family peptidase [Gaiellaceae bacterium]
MRKNWRVGRRAAVIVAALAACAAFAARASAAPVQGFIQVNPATLAASNPFGPCLALASGINCYVPDEIRAAYDYPAALDGSGQTIVIVDAFHHPFVERDLAIFDFLFGIPDPPDFVQLQGPRVTPPGIPVGDQNTWARETALDVEWAHAMAPGARIVLIEAATDDDADIAAAERAFLPLYPGAVVSQSFGVPEPFVNPASLAAYHSLYQAAIARGGTIVAATGDVGANWAPFLGPDAPALAAYPASDPLVTAVGGTQGLTHDGSDYGFGLLTPAQTYGDEQVWNEPFAGATGGAPSVLFAAPPWQRPVSPYKTRTVPDVAYNAALDGGVYVWFSKDDPSGPDYGKNGLGIASGTSVAAPQWAAIFALADQARAAAGKGPLGFANESLYKIAKQNKTAGAFHDITVGNNAFMSNVGFSAAPGYDAASGLGTPDVGALIPALVAASASSNPDAGAPAAVQPGTTGNLKPHRMLPG